MAEEAGGVPLTQRARQLVAQFMEEDDSFRDVAEDARQLFASLTRSSLRGGYPLEMTHDVVAALTPALQVLEAERARLLAGGHCPQGSLKTTILEYIANREVLRAANDPYCAALRVVASQLPWATA